MGEREKSEREEKSLQNAKLWPDTKLRRSEPKSTKVTTRLERVRVAQEGKDRGGVPPLLSRKLSLTFRFK